MTLSKARFIFLWPFYMQVILVNLILRLLLVWQDGTIWWTELPEILFWGGVHDSVFFSFFAIPIVLYLWLTPARVFIHSSNRGTMHLLSAVYAFIVLILAFFEYGFWFNNKCRFNELAAQRFLHDSQFLVSSTQGENLFIVIPLILFLGILLWLIFYKVFNYYFKKQEMVYSNFRFRLLPALFFMALPFVFFYSLEYQNQSLMPVETHWNKDQLKKNGPYQMMSLIYQKKLYLK